MTETLIVVLEGRPAGVLTRASGGRLEFEYADEYRGAGDVTPLSVSMPIPIKTHPHEVVSPWLWNLLPDNERVLDRWGREFQVSPSSAFALLATPVGHDCAGAVQFVAPDELETVLARPGAVDWFEDDEGIAQRLRDLRQDSTTWLGREFTGQFSLAGAQAKPALLFEDGRWGVPKGAEPTSHILKPAVEGLVDQDLNEHLCLDAAHQAGLTTAETRVQPFADESAIVVTRYDRSEDNGTRLRVHQEDLCQALSLPPGSKYQNDGGPGPADVVRLFRDVMAPRAAEDAVSRFLDALAWNWIIAGPDAHAKNYSLLLSGSDVRLAPMYDVASALPYDIHERKLQLAMKLGGDYRMWPWANRWPAALRELDVDIEAGMARVGELVDRAPDAFSEAAAADDVKALDRRLPARLVDAVAERAARCAESLEEPEPTSN